jgi:hypothetical protein
MHAASAAEDDSRTVIIEDENIRVICLCPDGEDEFECGFALRTVGRILFLPEYSKSFLYEDAERFEEELTTFIKETVNISLEGYIESCLEFVLDAIRQDLDVDPEMFCDEDDYLNWFASGKLVLPSYDYEWRDDVEYYIEEQLVDYDFNGSSLTIEGEYHQAKSFRMSDEGLKEMTSYLNLMIQAHRKERTKENENEWKHAKDLERDYQRAIQLPDYLLRSRD